MQKKEGILDIKNIKIQRAFIVPNVKVAVIRTKEQKPQWLHVYFDDNEMKVETFEPRCLGDTSNFILSARLHICNGNLCIGNRSIKALRLSGGGGFSLQLVADIVKSAQ